jgi:predicted nuclease with RNAse H fold
VAGDLGEALDFARSMESEGQVIEAYGKAVIVARRLIVADGKLHALSNAGYEDAAIRADQKIAYTLRGAIMRQCGSSATVRS